MLAQGGGGYTTVISQVDKCNCHLKVSYASPSNGEPCPARTPAPPLSLPASLRRFSHKLHADLLAQRSSAVAAPRPGLAKFLYSCCSGCTCTCALPLMWHYLCQPASSICDCTRGTSQNVVTLHSMKCQQLVLQIVVFWLGCLHGVRGWLQERVLGTRSIFGSHTHSTVSRKRLRLARTPKVSMNFVVRPFDKRYPIVAPLNSWAHMRQVVTCVM